VTARGDLPCCAMKKLSQIFRRVVRQFDGLGNTELDRVVCPGCVISQRAVGTCSVTPSPPQCFHVSSLRHAAQRKSSSSLSSSSSSSSSLADAAASSAASAAVSCVSQQRSVDQHSTPARAINSRTCSSLLLSITLTRQREATQIVRLSHIP